MFKRPSWGTDWFKEKRSVKSIEPDWDVVLQMAAIPISNFVALTMGCTLDVIENSEASPITLSAKGRSIVGRLYNDRLAILENNWRTGNFPGCSDQNYGQNCRLKETIQWVHDRGWELPEPMMKLINQERKEKKALPDEFPRAHPKWRKAYEYESEGMKALYDLIEKSYIDAKGNPISDMKKLPLKKNLESEWLKGRTLIEADTIITSGKRNRKPKE